MLIGLKGMLLVTLFTKLMERDKWEAIFETFKVMNLDSENNSQTRHYSVNPKRRNGIFRKLDLH